MRSRDVTIPLALWICAAICAHFVFGTGGLVVAKVHDDQSELWKLSRIASGLAKQGEQTFEVSLGDPSDEPKQETAAPPKPPSPKPPPPPAPIDSARVETLKRPEEKPKPEKRVLLVNKADGTKPLPLPEDVLRDKRIAVRQHAKPNQDDNPTAKFIADQANRVDQETRATQTSHDRDDERPSPGATHRGTESAEGDSEKTRIADSEEHKGEKNRAPGERGQDLDVQKEPKIPKATPQATSAVAAAEPPAAARGVGSESRPSSPSAPQAEAQPTPGGASTPSPEVENAPDGTWTFNPARQGGAPGLTPQEIAGGQAQHLPGGRMWSLPGLGQSALPGTLNTNLNQGQVASIVGSDNLRRMREADGERRKSEHRGSWTASNFDRWRSAIENYASSVKPGNQTALNTAQSPFATYLNGMHNRIHPIFAESFLESLDRLPPGHPMNDQTLVTRLEIVLTKEGRLKKMGIVKNSGVTAFDIAALDAVDRAQPFGPAPNAIISADGNVYLHWEFHRDEVYACSTMNARPYILNTPGPGNEGPPQPTPSPGPAKERGAPPSSPNDAREGSLTFPARGSLAQSGT